MNEISKNNYIRITTFLLLGFFGFLFLHSELSIFDCDIDNHDAHDFCILVKSIGNDAKSLKDELPKPDFFKIIYSYVFDNSELNNSKIHFNLSNSFIISKQSTKYYLINHSFLI